MECSWNQITLNAWNYLNPPTSLWSYMLWSKQVIELSGQHIKKTTVLWWVFIWLSKFLSINVMSSVFEIHELSLYSSLLTCLSIKSKRRTPFSTEQQFQKKIWNYVEFYIWTKSINLLDIHYNYQFVWVCMKCGKNY